MRRYRLVKNGDSKYGCVLSPVSPAEPSGLYTTVQLNVMGHARDILGDQITVEIKEDVARLVREAATVAGWRNSVSFMVNHIEDFILNPGE